MSFGPWFPLSTIGLDQHAPGGPAAVQVKREAGLISYPSGKSAMVFYFFAETDAHKALESLFDDEAKAPGERGQGPLRFRVWEGSEAKENLEHLYGAFVERFGAPPLFHSTDFPTTAARAADSDATSSDAANAGATDAAKADA